MGIKSVIQNRLLASAKSIVPKGRWRPGKIPLRMVGLILYLEDLSELRLLKRVQDFFIEQGAVCHVCIYQEDKKIEVSEEIIDDDMVLLNRDSINWYGAVRPGCAEFLVHGSFDIVVDLSKGFFFPISYLASLTTATMKIGRYVHPKIPYRLVLGANDPEDADSFFDLLENCLHFISFE